MRRRSRFRWFCTLLATVPALLFSGLWLASGWYWIYLSDGRSHIAYLLDGRVTAKTDPTRKATTLWSYGSLGGGKLPPLTRGGGWQSRGSETDGPLIDLAAPSVALAALFWLWPGRRIAAGRCRRCEYDLTGNTTGRCPECGKPV